MRPLIALVAAASLLTGCTSDGAIVVADHTPLPPGDPALSVSPSPTPTSTLLVVPAPDTYECREPKANELNPYWKLDPNKPAVAVDAGGGWAVVVAWTTRADGSESTLTEHLTNGERYASVGPRWTAMGVELPGAMPADRAALDCAGA